MKFAFIKQHLGHAAGWTLGVLCRVIGVTHSVFYAWRASRKRPPTKRHLTRPGSSTAQHTLDIAHAHENHIEPLKPTACPLWGMPWGQFAQRSHAVSPPAQSSHQHFVITPDTATVRR